MCKSRHRSVDGSKSVKQLHGLTRNLVTHGRQTFNGRMRRPSFFADLWLSMSENPSSSKWLEYRNGGSSSGLVWWVTHLQMETLAPPMLGIYDDHPVIHRPRRPAFLTKSQNHRPVMYTLQCLALPRYTYHLSCSILTLDSRMHQFRSHDTSPHSK